MDFKIVSEDGLMGKMSFDKDDDLRTAIYVSLNTDLGSFFQRPSLGSKLFRINNTTQQSLNLARQYTEQALQWILDIGRANYLNVLVEKDFSNPNRMNIRVGMRAVDGTEIEYETFRRVV